MSTPFPKGYASPLAAVALTLFLGCQATNRTREQQPKPVVTIAVASPDGGGSLGDIHVLPPSTPKSESDSENDAGTCHVIVGALLSANVYSGVRDSPARLRTKEALDPQTRAQWDAADHGVTYLSCVYAIRMNGHGFTYDHEGASNVDRRHDHVEPAECKTADMRAEVQKQIVSFTHGCSDPHAGAYWGFDLTPTD